MNQRWTRIKSAVLLAGILGIALPGVEAGSRPPGCAFSYQTYTSVVHQQHGGMTPSSYRPNYSPQPSYFRPGGSGGSWQTHYTPQPSYTHFQPHNFQPTSFKPTYFTPTYFQPHYFKPTYFTPTHFQPTVTYKPTHFTPTVTYKPTHFTPTHTQPTHFTPTHTQPTPNQGNKDDVRVTVKVRTQCGSCHGCKHPGGGGSPQPTVAFTQPRPTMPTYLVQPVVPVMNYPTMPQLALTRPTQPIALVQPKQPTLPGAATRPAQQVSETPAVEMPVLPPLETAGLPEPVALVTPETPAETWASTEEVNPNVRFRENNRTAIAANSPASIFEPPALPPLPDRTLAPPLPELPKPKSKPGSNPFLPPPLPPPLPPG